ncbi:hypothetical protein FQZ97_954760 [compost metagenome]
MLRRDDQDDPVSWKDRWAPKSDAQLDAHYRALTRYALDNKLIRKDFDITQDFATGFTNQAILDLKLESYWPSLSNQVTASH